MLVRLHAASLNYLDLAIVNGAHVPPSLPLIPVTDGAGEIAALGDAVSQWHVGDRVALHFD